MCINLYTYRIVMLNIDLLLLPKLVQQSLAYEYSCDRKFKYYKTFSYGWRVIRAKEDSRVK